MFAHLFALLFLELVRGRLCLFVVFFSTDVESLIEPVYPISSCHCTRLAEITTTLMRFLVLGDSVVRVFLFRFLRNVTFDDSL